METPLTATVDKIETLKKCSFLAGLEGHVLNELAARAESLRAVLQREREIVQEIKTRSSKLLSYQKEMKIGRRIQADFLALPGGGNEIRLLKHGVIQAPGKPA